MAQTADPRVAVLEEINQRFDALDRRLSSEIGGLRNDMNQRLARLDGHLLSSFLWLLDVIFAGYGGLFYLIVHGFKWF
jgi:hypothetical protein